MRVMAAILAAGKGTRFGSDKVHSLLRGKPLWRFSYETFLSHPDVDGVGIVCAPDSIEPIREQAKEAAFVIAGGSHRQESSKAAVTAAGKAELLLIHDAARPFASANLISRVIEGVKRSGAAAPAIPVIDTVREQASLKTVPREGLVAMQTPQGARTEWLAAALTMARETFTDEVALLQAAGYTAELVEGESGNFKITTPEDIERAAAIVGTPETRTGFGYDVHAFSKDPARKCVLGGVEFTDAPGLEGHSDADVLLHAIVDALLGAAALGDIGQHFPNTEPEWKNKPSIYFLTTIKSHLERDGWRILNIDATLIAEVPKVMQKAEAMRTAISQALGLDIRRVSIKATTNEHLGFIGREEGIAAFAVATLAERN